MRFYFLLGLLYAPSVYGQFIGSSPYSFYGIGSIRERGSAWNRSLSGTGIALRDDMLLNSLNPAAYTSISSVTQITELGLFYQNSNIKSSQTSEKWKTGNLQDINFWFRFSKRWAGSIGIAPFSNVDYTVLSARDFGEEENVQVSYDGRGGVSQFYTGHGYQVTKNLSIGIHAFLLFGNIAKTETIESGISKGIRLSDNTYLQNVGMDFGLQYEFMLNGNKSLVIGATYRPKINLNSSGSTEVTGGYGRDSLWFEQESVRDYIIPGKISLGASYKNENHIFSSDAAYTRWQTGYLGDVKLRNSWRTSAGYEYTGSKKPETYWHTITLRAGVHMEQNHFIVRSQKFINWGITLGTGIPVGNNRGLLNLSYHYNHTGTKNKGLLVQTANTLSLDISIRDVWGIRRKFD
jgi:hypothetical protein